MSDNASHFYSPIPELAPKHFTNGRNSTLRDARKGGWYPSPTTVLSVLAKPALEAWKIRNACQAVLTSPRRDGEALDAFFDRVLMVDKEQEQESDIAKDLGKRIHAAIEAHYKDSEAIVPYYKDSDIADAVTAAVNEVQGTALFTERILGHSKHKVAGTVDLATLAHRQEADFTTTPMVHIYDFKTASRIPRTPYEEARLQVSFYAAAYWDTIRRDVTGREPTNNPYSPTQIRAFIIYVGTKEMGTSACYEIVDWQDTFERGFLPCLQLWRWMKDYQ